MSDDVIKFGMKMLIVFSQSQTNYSWQVRYFFTNFVVAVGMINVQNPAPTNHGKSKGLQSKQPQVVSDVEVKVTFPLKVVEWVALIRFLFGMQHY